jgi:hypothetical protein
MRQAKFTCQQITGIERWVEDLLEVAAERASPPLSKTAICRQGIYWVVQQYCPKEFEENQKKPSNSEKVIPIIPAAAE